MTKFELYNILCSINDIVEEEQYGPETKLKEIRKLLDWTFPQIDPEMLEGEKMTLDLLERIFQDLEANFSLEEAKKKAKLFYKCAKNIGISFAGYDYWLQIGREWDLNIYDCDGTDSLAIYPVYKVADCFHTNTNVVCGIDI